MTVESSETLDQCKKPRFLHPKQRKQRHHLDSWEMRGIRQTNAIRIRSIFLPAVVSSCNHSCNVLCFPSVIPATQSTTNTKMRGPSYHSRNIGSEGNSRQQSTSHITRSISHRIPQIIVDTTAASSALSSALCN